MKRHEDTTRPIEQPETRTGRHEEELVTTHPAFGQITLHRTEGSRGALYGSDFEHGACMTIRIHESELHRDLHRDWMFTRKQYIEVALSEAQWATFVSSQGVGAGVPCTIQHIAGEGPIPRLPMPETRTDQFSREMKDKLGRILARCDDLMAGAKTKKQREEIALLKQDLEKNLPFTAKQFDEHMETTVEAAKTEIHGYMTGAIQRAGLQALGATPLLELPSPDEGDA